MGGTFSGNGGADIFIDSASEDVELWSVTVGSAGISDNGTRTRWNGVIAGGPLGGTDISSLTGAQEGDEAVADGTDASATAYEKFIFNSNGDWQSIADPSTTITPA
jgi:hypothetical protein